MHWIFITLVTLNLLVLAYFWQNKQPETSNNAPVAVDIGAAGKQLKLVKELAEPLAVVAKATPPPSSRAQLCYNAGPFAEEQDAKNLLARANALSFTGQINTVAVAANKPSEYWVYITPRISRDEALRTLRELQQRKLDSYIITQGELAEGVSLGLFRNKESAYSLQKQVRNYGLPAEVRVINESMNEYWVEIKESAQLSEALRERIQAGKADMRWEMLECQQ